MRLLLAVLLLTAAVLVVAPSEAQTPDSAAVSVCAPPLPVVAGAAIGAGFIDYCVYYPATVQPGSSFYITGVLTAPATVAPVFSTAANSFLSPVGCTEGTPQTVVPTTNGVVGTIWTSVTTMTMTGEQCDLVAAATLTIAAIPLLVYNVNLALNIQTENVRVDNFNYLCDAPAIAPNAYSTTGTTCNDPVLSLSGTLNAIMSGAVAITGTLTVSDDAGGWAIHQDPLSGGLLIQVCGQDPDAACSPIEVNSNSTVSIGNATQNVSLETEPGFWELFGPTIFALIFIACLAGVAIWLVPGAVAFGMMVAIMAFQQPHAILVLLQACAGFILTGAAMFWIVQRRDEFTTKRAKREPRRFFD